MAHLAGTVEAVASFNILLAYQMAVGGRVFSQTQIVDLLMMIAEAPEKTMVMRKPSSQRRHPYRHSYK